MFPVRLGFSSCADHNRYFANISKGMFSQRDITRNILHCSVGLPFYRTVFNVQAFHFYHKSVFCFVLFYLRLCNSSSSWKCWLVGSLLSCRLLRRREVCSFSDTLHDGQIITRLVTKQLAIDCFCDFCVSVKRHGMYECMNIWMCCRQCKHNM